MSMELANEKWLDGDESGLLGQFASSGGYSELIEACNGYPELTELFDTGASENIDALAKELKQVIAEAPAEVASTASGLLELLKGQEMVMVTNGGS